MSVATLLNGASANTTGPTAWIGVLYGNFTVAVSTTGTVSAFSVQVLGSVDGANFEAIGPAITSPTAGTTIGSGVLFQYFQATLSGYSGTGTVTCELAYSLETSASGGGGPPTGAAGGVLSGTYPNPGLAASPALTGTPTAPTASALADSTQVATAAYADSAVAVETSRAETAEALKLAKASNLSDVASQQTALNNIAGAVTSGDYLRGTGSNVAMSAIQAGDVPALNQNTTGTAGGLSSTLVIGSGGTGHTTAAAAFNALNPNAAPAQFNPGNPTGTTSTTLVMMGLGSTCSYTPTGSGIVAVMVMGAFQTNTSTTTVTISGRYGTGTAPANGAAVTGTLFGPSSGLSGIRCPGTGVAAAFALNGLITGLSASTAVWLDLALLTTTAADQALLTNLCWVVFELPAG